MKKKNIIGQMVAVSWQDSYGVSPGWQDISSYKANVLKIDSLGFLIYENTNVIALAHNYAEETDLTPKQANGIMVIPKACIIKITSFSSSYPQPELKQKLQQF